MESQETRKTEIQKTDFVWMDGKIVAWDEANVPVMTHGLHYGTGVFEGIRGYGVEGNLLVFRLHDHFERLISSAKICDITPNFSASELEDACLSMLRANRMKEDCYIRPITFVGFSGINLGFMNYPVSTAILAFPFKHYFSKVGLDVCVSSWTRIYDPVTPPMAKICGNYVNSVFAKREAAKNGFDEAIMLNCDGKVSEATGENVFVIKKGKMYTPGLGASILEGITRNTVIELAEKLGIETVERDVARSELYTADELFLTGTAAGIAPVVSVDRRPIANGGLGKITKTLSDAYTSLFLGQKTYGHDEWVTKVY
ncbi:MAG: branched-chain amino acid transaminase [Thaumarchaeota archaeon]|nr:branched-chain amino acid transaminase [Nitrososphaerota archaeon]